MTELRDYQKDVYSRVQDSIANGNRHILVVMPCRTGKSYIFKKMAEMASGKGGSTLVLVHRHELRDQHADLLDGVDNADVGMVITESHHKRSVEPTVIVTDEAHLSMADSYRAVINMYPNAYVIGFTATPIRLDGKPLGDMYDDIVIGPSVSWAIENKYISDFKYYCAQLFDLSSLKKRCGEFTESSMMAVMESESARRIYSDVIAEWARIAGDQQTIVYCISIEHSENMAERFISAGYNAEAVSSHTGSADREAVFDRFRSGETQLLCNVGIISEGVTFPDVCCCLLLRPTASHALYWQQAMRCMTYVDGKEAAIIDCVDNYKRLPMLDDDVEWSLTQSAKRRKKEGMPSCSMKLCGDCLSEVPAASKICPICGNDLTRTPNGTEIKELREYNMVLLDRKKDKEAKERLKKAARGTKDREALRYLHRNKNATLEDYETYRRIYHPEYKKGWSWYQFNLRKKVRR